MGYAKRYSYSVIWHPHELLLMKAKS
uniref:Uncharacterized protein n=1 Tax=Arundo donax TaxID=35708 RepID=A0A0A9AWU8_ARUDO